MKKVIKLLLIVVWMGLIFAFSSDVGDISTKKSDGVIIKTVEFFLGRTLGDLEREKWTGYLVVPVRKGAHFFIYFILGILMISFCQEFGPVHKKMVLLAVFLSFLYACSDETHQLFVLGRSGQFCDVVLDTIGSFVGILGYQFIHNKIKGGRSYE